MTVQTKIPEGSFTGGDIAATVILTVLGISLLVVLAFGADRLRCTDQFPMLPPGSTMCVIHWTPPPYQR